MTPDSGTAGGDKDKGCAARQSTTKPCGSGLARESAGSVHVDGDCDTAFASKPAPARAISSNL
ncbi:hypothetical protein C1894_28775 [Pseudomonas sp. FW305-3-2-15-E-TSA2]|nr:hypothetical protein C1895_28585 [Pseudomonas sp. FW305-3-2-15-E-TSA4]POA30870.1 hypothetical protein C1894_28775 [Pseudomonas sp. FW305-3-2-15-E-TSA2]